MISTVWLDREELHPDSSECSEDIIKTSADAVIKVIDEEAKLGIPDDRIIVGMYHGIFAASHLMLSFPDYLMPNTRRFLLSPNSLQIPP
jgi:hypothetical protein